MKICVTGATGFLGKFLCQRLEKAGHSVTKLSSVQCDLQQADSLKAFSETTYDQIYHLAAWTQAGDFCLSHPGEQWIINQKINTHVLDWWQRDQPQAKLIFMGTSCAYAEGANLVETEYMKGEPIDSLYTYAMTKRMLFQGARALNKQYGLNYLCFVPSTLYGPGYHTDGRQMHFIFDLIRKIIRAKEYGEQVTLWGTGDQTREIVHAEDFIAAMLALVETQNNDIINIGAGEEYSIKTFAQTICQHVHYDSALIDYDTSKYTGAKSKCLDIAKLQHLLPDFKHRNLQEGIGETIDWFYQAKAY